MITGDTVSTKMAGPAIRAWELASELSRYHDVRLLAAKGSDLNPEQFLLNELSAAALPDHLNWADVVVLQGFVARDHPAIWESRAVLVADLYDPFHLENLEMLRDHAAVKRNDVFSSDLEVLSAQLCNCDFFVCASEKQRDFWLGQLAAARRLNPLNYDRDPTLRKLIDLLPFGISSRPPVHTKQVLKGVVPGIQQHDKVLLWGGGIYNWLDPLTLIKAVGELAQAHPEVKLFFMGVSNPNPEVPEMRMVSQARDLAADLRLTGRHVFFNEGWVPYEERANYLLEADIGVSCHLDQIETAYSYRTRVLDYLWAKLPVIVTRGDSLSQLVVDRRLGLTVDAADVRGCKEAISCMLENDALVRELKVNAGNLHSELIWSEAVKPLGRFCSKPQPAADLRNGRAKVRPGRVRRLGSRVGGAWTEGGLLLVGRRAAGFIRRLRVR